LRGRLITDADRADSLPVILISQEAAVRLFPNEDPIGHRVRTGGAESGPWRTIVGVVADVHHDNLVVPVGPQMYAPQAQWTDGQLVMVVKSASVSPESLMPSIR